jgi:hypothetical protein
MPDSLRARVDGAFKIKKHRAELRAPKILCVYDPKKESATLKFITQIANAVFKARTKIHLDFSATEQITAAASVLLFAEITRCQLQTCVDDVVTLDLPKTEVASNLFTSTGLLSSIRPGGACKVKGSVSARQLIPVGNRSQ